MVMIKSSVLLLLPFAVSAEEGYYSSSSSSNNNNNNSVNNFGGSPSSTTSYSSSSSYTNSNGNTYSNPSASYTNSNNNNINSSSGPLVQQKFGGMDQTDDFMGAMGSYGGDMMAMMFGQCLNNIDINKMMDDPFVDAKNRCSDQQAVTFNNALDSFKTCAGFDLKELIEDFGSIYIGFLLNCGSYVIEIENMRMEPQDEDQLKAKESPLPRVPQECVDALVGDNPFGTAFLYVEEFPEREQKCFSELAGKLPMCTLSEWPVPIVGSWLSAVSCIYGNAQDVIMPLMQDTLTSELMSLNKCIPEEITQSNCKDIRNKCLFDYTSPPMTMALPPPFWNPPIPQNFKDIAANQLGDLMARYDTFRQTCVPPADLAIWDIAAGHKEKNKGVSGGASYYMEESSEDEAPKKEKEMGEVEDEAAGLGAAAAVPPAAAASGGGSTKFMPGLLTGMIVAVAGMFGYQKYRNGGQMPGGGMNMGYQFNSLELSEGPVFS